MGLIYVAKEVGLGHGTAYITLKAGDIVAGLQPNASPPSIIVFRIKKNERDF